LTVINVKDGKKEKENPEAFTRGYEQKGAMKGKTPQDPRRFIVRKDDRIRTERSIPRLNKSHRGGPGPQRKEYASNERNEAAVNGNLRAARGSFLRILRSQ